MISHLVNSFLLGILVADMLERRIPDEFTNTVTTIAYNVLYFFSKIQIAFGKIQNIILNFIEASPILSKIKNILSSIIKPARNTLVTYIKNGEYMALQDINKFDFVIFSWVNNEEKCFNQKIIYDLNASDCYPPYIWKEFSDVRFLLLEIVIGENNKYKVDLKTEDYNFYLVGNKFTKQFFLYYLKQILKINITINDEDTFIVNIIDQDVNKRVIDLSGKDGYILLDKNNYTICVTQLSK